MLQASGIILAGGQSRRMGQNKALLQLPGHTTFLIEYVIATLKPITEKIFISTNTPDVYAFLSLPCVPDRFPHMGPMAGLEAGLRSASSDMAFLVACDMPFIQSSLLSYLTAQIATYDAVVPLGPDGQPEPVCALYHKSCLASLEEHLQHGNVGMRRWLQNIHVNMISPEIVRQYDPHMTSFKNINTPEDLNAQ